MRADRLGHPLEVSRSRPGGQSATFRVARIDEAWRIAEEWWRDLPLARTYFRLVAEDGRGLTVFHDDTKPLESGWYEQTY